MVRATRWINCRTEVSRCGVPCSPKKYFETTTLVASCDQPLGTSTSSCLKMILPASSVISAVRLSHSSSSYGLRLASLNTRSTRMLDPFLPLAKPPRLGAVTLGARSTAGGSGGGRSQILVGINHGLSGFASGSGTDNLASGRFFVFNRPSKLSRTWQQAESYHTLLG
ncbi:MAG: hypothetical protein CM1200mP34_0990 [Verrucomicrobiales bacterium]|nr:MAG: hypothetical protein CM1200mP34_0990 [Verrucomicrobiales bacterium]